MSDNKQFDVVVIGSGPGGYVAAIRCAQLGMKTAIIERYDSLGGTCLNVGCIPSKAMLDSSHHYEDATKHFKEHGIEVKEVSVNFKKMIERKRGVVKQVSGGVDFLMKKNKIEVFHGHGSFASEKEVEIKGNDGKTTTIEGKNIIIATGSKPASIPGVEIDKKRIITSTEALELKEIPKKMIVIGAGIIGSELGQVYSRLGSEITVLEYMDKVIPTMDHDLGKELERVLKRGGMNFKKKYKVKSAENKGDKVVVKAENPKGEEESFEADLCLVAVGRKAYTDKLNLEKAGLSTDDRGRIEVNDHLETKVEGIYAIGDVVRGAMLAHKAEDEGLFIAEKIAGQKPHINYLLIPNVVYCWPEVAGVGYTEQELKEKKIKYKSGKFSFKASGRAVASMDTDGFVKVLADKETDEVLGVHMIGPRIADIIAEAVVAMEYRASAEDIARICHAHPTYTESVKEAAMAATGNRAIHA